MSKKKKDMVQAVKDAPKASRVLPTSEALLHRTYGIIERFLDQLEIKASTGAELTKDDATLLRTAQQGLVDLRRDERDTLKSGADDDLSEDEVRAILEAKLGVKLLDK